VIAIILDFIKKLFGIGKSNSGQEAALKNKIKQTETKIKEIENEKLSDNDIVDHFNNK